MNLYEQIQHELDSKSWNYYNMKVGDVLKNTKKSRDFIARYFCEGDKKLVIDSWQRDISKTMLDRSVHTVNVFFIGIILQKIIDPSIAIISERRDEDREHKEHKEHYLFSYIWYLVCLAHDMGYTYEDSSEMYLKELKEIIKISTPGSKWALIGKPRGIKLPNRLGKSPSCWKNSKRTAWYGAYGIDIAYEFSDIKKINYSNGTIIDAPQYTEDIINRYLAYRAYEKGILDHGIIGADELFSKLTVNYIKQYREVYFMQRNSFDSFFSRGGRSFSIDQFNIFAYIADCIAAHNVYSIAYDNPDAEVYRSYGLESLISDRFVRISYERNPLLFVLCVADTIEPSKRFRDYTNEEILKLISINYDPRTKYLEVLMDKKLYKSREGWLYKKTVEELETWCDIHAVVEAK